MPKIEIEVEYTINQVVYLRTDPDQLPHLVIGYKIVPTGILYGVVFMGSSSYFYAMELSTDRNQNIVLGMEPKNEQPV